MTTRLIGAAIAISILGLLGAIHLYWAAGGQAGKQAAIPSRDGRPVISPTSVGTAIVGLILIAAGAMVAATASLPAIQLPSSLLRGATFTLAAIFLLRAVGDFRYVGMFKSVEGSRFARYDRYVYVPLCLSLALLIAFVAAT